MPLHRSPALLLRPHAVLSALFFAAQIFRTEKVSRRLGPESTMPLMSVSLSAVAACTFAVTAVAHAHHLTELVARLQVRSQRTVNRALLELPAVDGHACCMLALCLQRASTARPSFPSCSVVRRTSPGLTADPLLPP